MKKAERIFSAIGESHYLLEVGIGGVTLAVDRLRRERHELVGELAVRCDLPGSHAIDGYVSIADFNLSSATARNQRAKLLRERSDAELDWTSWIEELCQRVIRAERDGVPSRPLHLYDEPGQSAIVSVNGWPLLRDHPSILFGDGGTLKSYLALYAAGCLSLEGLLVLFCDWELNGGDHRGRLARLFGPALPLVHYLRCERPMVDEADRIRREAGRLGIDYLVCDSVGFATGGPPEAAEHATAYFRALRSIPVAGSLNLAHINRSENGDQKPFGSAFWHNSARSTWFAKQASESTDGRNVTVGLFNRKSNLTRVHPGVGFQFTFNPDSTLIERVNLADVAGLAGQLPLWQRAAHILRSGKPLTLAQLAEELDAKEDSVKKAISRKSMFAQVPSTDGKVRFALVERRIA